MSWWFLWQHIQEAAGHLYVASMATCADLLNLPNQVPSTHQPGS
jgi:hypothetical protein